MSVSEVGHPTVDFAVWMRVSDVLQSYADAIDRADVPGILALFAPDGVWAYSPTELHQGHAAIGDFFRARMSNFAQTSHNVCPPIVRPGREHGEFESTAYYQGKHTLLDGTMYCVWGRYVDRFRVVDGTLLIVCRAVVAHVTEGTDRVYNMLPRGTGLG